MLQRPQVAVHVGYMRSQALASVDLFLNLQFTKQIATLKGSMPIRLSTFRLRHFVYYHTLAFGTVIHSTSVSTKSLFSSIPASTYTLNPFYQSRFHWHYDNTPCRPIVSKHNGLGWFQCIRWSDATCKRIDERGEMAKNSNSEEGLFECDGGDSKECAWSQWRS